MRTPPPRPSKKVVSTIGFAPRPSPFGSILLLAGLVLTTASLHGDLPSTIARSAAIGAGVSICVSSLFDLRLGGFRNMIRADLLAILAFYFLTLFEFLFQQTDFDSMTDPETTREAATACLLGLFGLVVGRHLPNLRKRPLSDLFTQPVPRSWLIFLLGGFLMLGTFHMLLAVDFNPVEMISAFMGPRFSQPWGRGRYGDWKALLHELGMVLYLVPPLAGIILARRKNFNVTQIIFTLGCLLFVLFFAFSSGTRNILASCLVTFLIGYAFALRGERRTEFVILSAACAALLLVSTILMLNFREVGLQNYVLGRYEVIGTRQQAMYVDYNLYSICRLINVFPNRHDYLAWEIPYLALIRPIPRALWPGKPEGMSMTIEDAVGAEEMTVSASFVGEAYMSGGLTAVLLAGLFFGFVTGWWSHLASPRNSELGILIYSSGFSAAVISMRSLFVFTTALLPTLAIIIIGKYIVKKLRHRWIRPKAPAMSHQAGPPKPNRNIQK